MVAVRSFTSRESRNTRQSRILPLVIFSLFIPAILLSFAAAGSGALSGDVAITLFVQTHLPDQLAWLFEAVNAVGSTAGAVLVTMSIGLLLLARRQPAAAAIILLTLPLRASNALLKAIFESPRPAGGLVSVTEHAAGFGFPSGHTMGATLLYGALFLLAPRLTTRRPLQIAIQISALAMVAMAGISRIYVGAHWPSDVLGGYLWATIFLLAGSLAIRALAAAPASPAQPRQREMRNLEALAEGD